MSDEYGEDILVRNCHNIHNYTNSCIFSLIEPVIVQEEPKKMLRSKPTNDIGNKYVEKKPPINKSIRLDGQLLKSSIINKNKFSKDNGDLPSVKKKQNLLASHRVNNKGQFVDGSDIRSSINVGISGMRRSHMQ